MDTRAADSGVLNDGRVGTSRADRKGAVCSVNGVQPLYDVRAIN